MKADSKTVSRLLKTARGQLDGVLRMVEEDRYCVDILNQVMAAEAVLRKVRREVLRAHIQGCVSDALQTGDEDRRQTSIEEILRILEQQNL